MDMETEVLCSMLRLLSQSLSRLLSDVQRRVQARDVDPESERSQQAVHEARNALKMYCFLLISTLQRTDVSTHLVPFTHTHTHSSGNASENEQEGRQREEVKEEGE